MAGMVTSVLDRTRMNFESVAAEDDATGVGTVVQRIDTSQYREGRVIARIFDISVQDSTNDDILLVVAPDPYDPNYPSTRFEIGGTLVAQSLYDSDLAGNNEPYALFFDITQFGPLLQVAVQATRNASSTFGNNLDIEVAIDLALKD